MFLTLPLGLNFLVRESEQCLMGKLRKILESFVEYTLHIFKLILTKLNNLSKINRLNQTNNLVAPNHLVDYKINNNTLSFKST